MDRSERVELTVLCLVRDGEKILVRLCDAGRTRGAGRVVHGGGDPGML